jgi:peptide/nickel transport system substrate-binding protein
MTRTRTAALAAAVALVAAAIAGCTGSGGATGGASGGTDELKAGVFLDVTSWDPANADIGFDGPYLSAVYDPLVTLDKDAKPVPALATSWDSTRW